MIGQPKLNKKEENYSLRDHFLNFDYVIVTKIY